MFAFLLLFVYNILAAVAHSDDSARLFYRYFLNETSSLAICNDNSSAAYYFRKGIDDGVSKWVIRLQGGGWCWNEANCKTRDKKFTTSTMLPPTMNDSFKIQGTGHAGILSSNPTQNPFFYNANQVYLWYCSSDSHLGNTTNWGLNFRGKEIVRALIYNIYTKFDGILQNAEYILVTGDSAGGVGATNNVDFIADLLNSLLGKHENDLHLTVKHANTSGDGFGSQKNQTFNASILGFIDAGWFLDIPTYKPSSTNFSMLAQSMNNNFNMIWDSDCMNYYNQEQGSNDYKCFCAQYMVQFVQTPLLFHEFDYDSANLGFDGVGTINTSNTQQMTYIDNFRTEMEYWQDFVQNGVVKWLFRPACYAHQCEDGANGGLMNITINGTTFANLLTLFMENGNVVQSGKKIVDQCTEFECNPTCP